MLQISLGCGHAACNCAHEEEKTEDLLADILLTFIYQSTSGSLTKAHFHPKANLISVFLRYTFYPYLSVPSHNRGNNQCTSFFFLGLFSSKAGGTFMAGRSNRKLTVPPAMHGLPLICPAPFPSFQTIITHFNGKKKIKKI